MSDKLPDSSHNERQISEIESTEEKRDRTIKQLNELVKIHNELNQNIIQATERRTIMYSKITRLQGKIEAFNEVIGPAVPVPIPEPVDLPSELPKTDKQS